MSELYYAWNRKGQPITKVGDDFLRPIAEELSLVNDYIFGDNSYFVHAPKSPTDFCNVVECVEPKPIWMPRMESCPILPLQEIMDMLKHPAGSLQSPLDPKTYVEGKLDEMRCYMVVWSDKIKKSYLDEPGGYVGYDLGLFTSDKYPNLKGMAVIHDIVAKWAYIHRKAWLEQDNLLPFLHLECRRGGVYPHEKLFVNRRVDPSFRPLTGSHDLHRPEWDNYHNSVREAVKTASGWRYPDDPHLKFKHYEGIVMKPRFHHYNVHYIEPNEVGNEQKVNIGGWKKLRWD